MLYQCLIWGRPDELARCMGGRHRAGRDPAVDHGLMSRVTRPTVILTAFIIIITIVVVVVVVVCLAV